MAPQDYTRRTWQAAVALIAVLTAVAFIPPQTIGGIRLRRANILSDVLHFNDKPVAAAVLPEPDDEFAGDFRRFAGRIEAEGQPAGADSAATNDAPAPAPADTLPAAPQLTFEWAPYPAPRTPERPACDTTRLLPALTPIEDFDTLADGPLHRFFARLADTARRTPVRIAVLGDSFIEGDILTADLREQLQLRYGGCGCGFAPMASPLTGYRRTVGTRSAGWNSHNIMQRRSTPQALRGDFCISGWLCRPAEGATVRWTGSDFRRRLDRCGRARLLFIAREPSRLHLTLNDTLHRTLELPASEALRQIVVHGPVASLALRVEEGAAGFTGYGAQFEDAAGVTVDNYSIRSNSGQALFGTSSSVNAQIGAFAPYDLVVLQYGLNIMQEGVTNYSAYAARLEKMIAFVRSCFPDAAVLVLSTSDRSVRSEKGFAPMSSAPSMVGWQRRATRAAGAAFWSVYDAMRAQGGMERFVANGWAGKDYTHINYAGGRQVAYALVDALNACVAPVLRERWRAAHPEPVLDSTRIVALDRMMSVAPQPIESR